MHNTNKANNGGQASVTYSGDTLTMLHFGKSNHDRIFKQRRLYLAIKVRIRMNTWQLMLDFDKKEQYPVIIFVVDWMLYFKQTRAETKVKNSPPNLR